MNRSFHATAFLAGSALAALLASAPARDGRAEGQGPPLRHLVLLEHGPNWPADERALEMKALEGHGRYVSALLAEGKVQLGGPAPDRAYGVLVFDLAERAEVERLLDADPAVAAGVFEPDIRPFRALSAADLAPRPALPPAPAGLEPVRLEVEVAAPLPDVWRAWSTAEGAQTFFAPKVVLELRPLGALEVLWAPDAPRGQRGAEDLRILAYVPERMLAFEWSAPPQFARARPQRTFVVIELEPLAPARTRVVLLHQGFAEQAELVPEAAQEWRDVRAYFEQAWPTVLDALVQRFAGGGQAASAREPGGAK